MNDKTASPPRRFPLASEAEAAGICAHHAFAWWLYLERFFDGANPRPSPNETKLLGDRLVSMHMTIQDLA